MGFQPLDITKEILRETWAGNCNLPLSSINGAITCCQVFHDKRSTPPTVHTLRLTGGFDCLLNICTALRPSLYYLKRVYKL